MKLLFIFMTACLIQVSASSYAQRITLTKKNASLISIFDQINKQSGLNFLVTNELLKGAKPVDINVKDEEVREVLDKVFKNQPLSYTIEDSAVIVSRKTPSFLPVIPNDRRNLFIDAVGKIVDETGKPLEGATVVLKGSARTAKTDAKGEFVIPNVPDDGVLVIRYVGYKQLEIALKDAIMPLEIKLNVATGELEEVKVVYNTGYQELNKERATGSFVYIDNELFNRRVGTNVLERISDLVPGLINNNIRGTTTVEEIRIRGTSTINANKSPLLVVDNFIYSGDINALNPNDVEDVTILKDAASASIWGVRAGNGVIVITTKKGKMNSGPAVNFNTNLTMVEKPDLFSLPIISSYDIIALERKRFTDGYYDAILNDKTTFPPLPQVVEILSRHRSGMISQAEADNQIAVYEQHDVRDDVNKYLLQKAITQQYALGISGGANNYRYRGSVGHNRSRPHDININSDNLTIGFNNTWTPMKGLQINAQLNWAQSNNESNNSGAYGNFLKNPYERLAGDNGNALAIPLFPSGHRMTYLDTVSFPGKLDWHYRPLDEAGNGNSLAKSNNTLVNGSINYTIIQGLKIDIAYSWQKGIQESTNIESLNTYAMRDLINQFTQKGSNNLPVYPYPLGGRYIQRNVNSTNWTLRGKLDFNRRFGKHEFYTVIGIERNESKIKGLTAPAQFGYNPETNVFGTILPGTWVTRPGGSSRVIGVSTSLLNGTLNRFGSLFGTVNYTYNQKYTLTGSARIDESNFFGVQANDRKVPLWSAGVKWDISKESFYTFSKVPNLSLSASYGYSGNVNAGSSPFATAEYANPGSPFFVPFARISTPPNPELGWENVRTINLALDFGSRNQRISGNFDLFHKKGTDLISAITVDPTSGFASYTGNDSSLEIKGIDLSLNTKNLDCLFKWLSSITFGFQRDKVTFYTVEPQKVGLTSGVFIGMPLSNIYSYRWAGLNPMNGDAQFYIGGQVVGSSNQGKQTQDDMVYHGQTNPSIFGAFRNDFGYKNISVSIGISYQFGHYFRRTSFNGTIDNIATSWQHKDYLRAWKSPGDEQITNVPGFLNSYSDARYGIFGASDILIEKGDHIRLQDIRLNYNLNKQQFKKLPFKNASFYMYANNLGFIWKTSKYNPDTKDNLSAAVNPRSIAAGVSINF